jgi:hypothetical protein
MLFFHHSGKNTEKAINFLNYVANILMNNSILSLYMEMKRSLHLAYKCETVIVLKHQINL